MKNKITTSSDNIRICKSCVLAENFPGAGINRDGLCKYCVSKETETDGKEIRAKYLAKFEDIIARTRGKSEYDVLMAYSGGKDSTYTLKVLKEKYDLKILAVTFDHGFISDEAKKNMKKASSALNVDLVVHAPDRNLLARTFYKSSENDVYGMKALERASAICNTCMHIAKSYFIKTAIEMAIPVTAYGWSPGQAPIRSSVLKLNPQMVKNSQEAVAGIFRKIGADELLSLLLDKQHYRMLEENLARFGGSFLYNVHPLAFMKYNEDRILDDLTSLSWFAPLDTDANSSNCLLNAYANKVHMERYDFHPYSFEVASLVREGIITRTEGLKRLSEEMDEGIVNNIEKQLSMNQEFNEADQP